MGQEFDVGRGSLWARQRYRFIDEGGFFLIQETFFFLNDNGILSKYVKT